MVQEAKRRTKCLGGLFLNKQDYSEMKLNMEAGWWYVESPLCAPRWEFLSIYLSCTVLVGGYIKCMSLFFSSACKNELETGK